jgi:hypothetical protein
MYMIQWRSPRKLIEILESDREQKATKTKKNHVPWNWSHQQMKTIRIFFNRIRDQIHLESISGSEYSTSDTVSISEYSNRVFMISISNRILSGMIDTIRIRIRIRTEIWKQDIRPYPIRFHPFTGHHARRRSGDYTFDQLEYLCPSVWPARRHLSLSIEQNEGTETWGKIETDLRQKMKLVCIYRPSRRYIGGYMMSLRDS